MAHIMRQSKPQAETHKRIERIMEDSNLPIVQCDYLVLKDVAAFDRLKLTVGNRRDRKYVASDNVDVSRLLIKLAESVKSKRQERTIIPCSPRRSLQSNGALEKCQKQWQRQRSTMLATLQDRTQCRQTTDSALMKWIVQHLVHSSFHRKRGTIPIMSCNGSSASWNGAGLSANLYLLILQRSERIKDSCAEVANKWKSIFSD